MAPQITFVNEGKDVLGDVLKDPNRQAISGDTGTFFEPVQEQAPPPAEAPVEAPKPPETPAAPVVSTSTAPPAPVLEAPPVAEKLYAGKFKSEADLEKAYTELEKSFTKKAEEAATLRKNAATVAETPLPPAPAGETPEQRLARINEMLDNPDQYFKKVYQENRAVEETQRQERAQVEARMGAWRETNKDLAKVVAMPDGAQVPLESFVGTMVANLTSQDPSMDPWAALDKATTHLRFMVGAIRDDGKKEALTVQSSVTPMTAKVNTPPPTEQPSPAPVTEQDTFRAHLAQLNANAASVRRPVR